MTTSRTTELVCSRCGQRRQVSYYHSIDAARDPTLVREILSLRMFSFICPECGLAAFSFYPFLFCDSDRHFKCEFRPDLISSLKKRDKTLALKLRVVYDALHLKQRADGQYPDLRGSLVLIRSLMIFILNAYIPLFMDRFRLVFPSLDLPLAQRMLYHCIKQHLDVTDDTASMIPEPISTWPA